MMGEEFDQWFEINHNRDLYDAWCAGAAAQRKRDVEIANKFVEVGLATFSPDIRLVEFIAAAIERQEVEG